MILLDETMDIQSILTMLMGGGAKQVPSGISQGGDFAALLLQAQAPPGPEPPPGVALAPSEEEQKTVEPNAQSKKPDFLLQANDPLSQIVQLAQGVAATVQNIQAVAQALTSGAPTIKADSSTKIELQIGNVKLDLPDFKSLTTLIAPQQAGAAEVKDPALAVLNDLLSGDKLNGAAVVPQAKAALDTLIQNSGKPTVNVDDLLQKISSKHSAGGSIEIQQVAESPAPEASPTTQAAPVQIAPVKPALQQNQAIQTAQLPIDPKQASTDQVVTAVVSQTGEVEEIVPVSDKKDAKTGDSAKRMEQPIPLTDSPKATQSADTAPKELTRRDVDHVINQVADRIEYLAAAKPRGGVTIHLDPKELGSITLVVKQVNGAVDAQVMTENSQVREALTTHQPQLGIALENRGLNLNSITVSGQSQLGADAQRQAFQQQDPHRGRPHTTFHQNDRGGKAEAEPRAQLATSGVDLWI